jgi:FkbM family methyltransferase
MKALIADAMRWVTRSYVRYAPWRFGKAGIFSTLVEPYFAWRPISTIARTRFGTRHHITSLSDFIQLRIYYFGIWEPAITQLIVSKLSPGDVFIDVGANIGYYSVIAAEAVGSGGAVHAIEASPSIFRLLRESIELNDASNIRAVNCAVHRERTKVRVFKAPETNLGKTTILDRAQTGNLQFSEEAEVPGLPLQEIVALEDLRRARLIKIDVEGAEWFVLEGIRPLLGQIGPDAEWIVEIDPASVRMCGGDVDTIVKWFAEHGCRPFRLTNTYRDDEYMSIEAGFSLEPLALPLQETTDILFTRRESSAA